MTQHRLAVLDGLRGVAVLLVLWYHIWEISWLPAPLPALQFIPETGFVGVHLFFYISGFVIVFPFVRAAFEGREPPSWSHFAFRRAVKIVPSYVLSIALAIAIGYAHFNSAGEALRAILTHLLFIHTWWTDTYGAINGVLWTLAVEVEFYLAFPLLWWAFKRAPWVTAALMIATSIGYRVWAQSAFPAYAPLLYENLPGYLDIFAFGMLSAYAYVRFRDRMTSSRASWSAVALAIGGFILLFALLQNLWSTRLVDQWAMVWQTYNRSWLGATFAVIALASLVAAPAWRRTLGNPVLLFFGAISYTLYLYHQIVARELLAHRIPPYAGASEHLDPHWPLQYSLIAFVVTIAQAAIFTYGFERPLLRLRPPSKTRALPPM
ncbi:MAG: acyltransferase [Candidatus Eremiobacteraeota bacterium]|nr:acyltransferase [Candidatus Eremiobacteraeota bacterium]